jgi:beta-lactamase superfamily II metal-dependent hydrolase
MSIYVKLVDQRKQALRVGDEEKAAELQEMIDILVESDQVTDEEFIGGAYI